MCHPLSKWHFLLSQITALAISIVRKFRKCQDLNPGRLGDKCRRFLCGMPSPTKTQVSSPIRKVTDHHKGSIRRSEGVQLKPIGTKNGSTRKVLNIMNVASIGSDSPPQSLGIKSKALDGVVNLV